MSDPNQPTSTQAKNLQTLEDYFKAKSASSKAQEELVSLENVSHESIKERCRVDLNFYAGLIIPRVMRVPFPAFIASYSPFLPSSILIPMSLCALL